MPLPDAARVRPAGPGRLEASNTADEGGVTSICKRLEALRLALGARGFLCIVEFQNYRKFAIARDKLKMAAKSKFWCDVCQKDFYYKSRFERHLETTSHKDKVRLIEICTSPEILEPENESTTADTGASSTMAEGHCPSVIATGSDSESLAIGDEDYSDHQEAEKDSDRHPISDSGGQCTCIYPYACMHA